MTIIVFISFIFFLVFCFCGFGQINNYIKAVSKHFLEKGNNKENNNIKIMNIIKKVNNNIKKKSKNDLNNFSNKKNKLNRKKNEPPKKNIKNKNINFKNKNKKPLKQADNNTTHKILIDKDMILKNNKIRNKINNHSENINIINIQNFNIKKVKQIKNEKKNEKKIEKIIKNNKTHVFRDFTKSKLTKKNIKNIEPKYFNLNDQELNSLIYEEALLFDKRTYFQYYWSLLKRKQLILFTFYPNNDYNLFSIKICLFLISFSLYITINGFFFNDDTMHKVYEDNGNFNIITQIPQILYSSTISALINMILKHLSLSENNILMAKQEKNLHMLKKIIKKIKRCLLIKFILFFILNFLFLCFFWYFITCFCAVYTNTQKILLEDTLMSFGLSMLYPFGLNLLPGFFRIPALRAEKKDKKTLYKIGNKIALI